MFFIPKKFENSTNLRERNWKVGKILRDILFLKLEKKCNGCFGNQVDKVAQLLPEKELPSLSKLQN